MKNWKIKFSFTLLTSSLTLITPIILSSCSTMSNSSGSTSSDSSPSGSSSGSTSSDSSPSSSSSNTSVSFVAAEEGDYTLTGKTSGKNVDIQITLNNDTINDLTVESNYSYLGVTYTVSNISINSNSNHLTSIENLAIEGCNNLSLNTDQNTQFIKGYRFITSISKISKLSVSGNLESYCFDHINNLESADISGNTKSIGGYAFNYCKSLTSVTIPNNVTSIGGYAFYMCVNLSSITIPNSVTSIGDYAFYDCSSITKLSIPDHMTNIGDYTFGWCTNATSISIPNSVTSIGDYAFCGCKGLTSITIPNSVTNIGDGAFYLVKNAIVKIPQRFESNISKYFDETNTYEYY